jgi:hypothetical protein
VGVPLVAIGVLALVLFLPGNSSQVPGSLHYDSRAAPLLGSVRATREQALHTSGCRGCADVTSRGGGCSGYQSDWTCDVPVQIHRPDPQIQAAQLPRTSSLLETYKVTWNQNGCWQASEDCISAADSSGHICPPPVVVILNGCISGH